MENKSKKVFEFNYELNENEKEILTAEKVAKENKFAALSEVEKIEVIKRIIENLKNNRLFNTTGKGNFFLSVYSNEKKEFTKGTKFQINGEILTLLEAVQTGSNNEIKISENQSLKLSGTSFKTNNGILKSMIFASLIPVENKPAK